jgi:hypothetical protein
MWEVEYLNSAQHESKRTLFTQKLFDFLFDELSFQKRAVLIKFDVYV